MRLCGSHLHFYACRHQSDRKLTPVYPLSTAPRKPYYCLAPVEVYEQCAVADRDGRKHLAAGITVNPSKEKLP